MFKRILGAVLMMMTLAFPLSLNMSVSADASVYSLYTSSADSILTISGTTATCNSIANGYSGKTTKIVFSQILQKKTSSGSWSNVTTWYKTVNSYKGTATNSKSGLAKGTYRLKTVFTVYAGSKCETITKYSATKTI